MASAPPSAVTPGVQAGQLELAAARCKSTLCQTTGPGTPQPSCGKTGQKWAVMQGRMYRREDHWHTEGITQAAKGVNCISMQAVTGAVPSVLSWMQALRTRGS